MSEQEGCYLLFHNDSGGRLELQYSKNPVEKAIAYWHAGEGKKIQGQCPRVKCYLLIRMPMVCASAYWNYSTHSSKA
jgi:hypothetical protein